MDTKRQLGEFLQLHRSRLQPADLGLQLHGDRRRVPGLRREELSQLAGVSASYYSRLEQGHSVNASYEVLEAIAQALQLDDAERQHLHNLADGTRRRAVARRPAPERIAPAVAELLGATSHLPVIVLGRRSDVLAWNAPGHALYAGHIDRDAPADPAGRPNMSRMVFLDAHTRELYVDWAAKARAVVATLRLASGANPADAGLASLIGELTVNSAEFASMWAAQRVKTGGGAVYEMRHPLVGTVHVTQQTLTSESGQRVVVATTAAGSASEAAMTLLVHGATTTPQGAARHPLPHSR